MKKIISVLCVFAMVFGTCACNTRDKKQSKRIIVKEEDNEVEQSDEETEETEVSETIDESEETEESTESTSLSGYKKGFYNPAQWSIETVELYKSDEILITAEELIDTVKKDSVGFVVYVNNNSKEDLNILCPEIYINNMLLYYSDKPEDGRTIAAHTSDTIVYELPFSTLKEFSINEIGMISISIRGYNINDYALFETDIIDVKTDAYDKMSTPFPAEGVLVVDNDELTIVITPVNSDEEECVIAAFVTNKLDVPINVDGIDTTVNGMIYAMYMRLHVPPGRSQSKLYNLYLIDEVYQNNAGSGKLINSMSIKFCYRTSNTQDPDWLSDPVTIKFN